jgi:hypothetical protein
MSESFTLSPPLESSMAARARQIKPLGRSARIVLEFLSWQFCHPVSLMQEEDQMNPLTSKTKRSFFNRAAAWLSQAGLLITLLGLASTQLSTALASPIFINSQVIINWAVPVGWTPSTPYFTGDSTFATGSFITTESGTFFFADSFFGATSIVGIPPNPVSFFIPPDPILPGDTLVWQLGGTVHTTAGDFPTYAFTPGEPILPADPPASAPLITLATNLVSGFTPIDLSGPIVAFDAPVQIGTWEIRITEAVPEPGSLALLGIGLAALATVAKARATRRAQA